MELSVLSLCVLNFVYIWLLPWIFFRKDGKKNIKWFMTALPFIIAPGIPLAEYLGYLHPNIQIVANLVPLQTGLSTILFTISISIISLTLGTHRIPVALWHQKHKDDEPEYVVTWGAYARIRHPFYAAFIIASFSMVLLTLHIFALIIFAYVFLVLRYTAVKEERRLSQEPNEVGSQYSKYMTQTGRFFPKLQVFKG